MPIDIIDVDQGLGNIILLSGVITESEFAEKMQTHLSQDQEKFRQYRYSLVDLSGITEIHLSTTFIKQHAHACIMAAKVNPDAIVAVVAPNDFSYGLSRMWEMLADEASWELCVFRYVRKATIWIKERTTKKWNLKNITIGEDT